MDATNFYAFALSFAAEHWFLAWCMLWLLWPVVTLPSLAFRLINRTYRVINIAIRGWPPAHLDADGDWRPPPKVVEEKAETVTCGDQSHTTTNKRRGERGLDPLRGFNTHPTTRHPRPGDPDYIASIDG